MSSHEQMSSYDKLRQKNALEKREMMKKLGLSVAEPKSPSPVPAKRGRSQKKTPSPDSSDEDYENFEDDPDDKDWETTPSKKRKKPEKKTPSEEVTAKWSDSTFSVEKIKRNEKDRYPKRDVFRPKYEDDYTPGTDDMLYCADCKRDWEGDCLEHGPLLVIQDTKVPPDINNKRRAMMTAPAIITVADSKIPDAGNGVWARDFIPTRVRFGPYDGKKVSHDVRNPYTWLIRKNGRPHHCVDATEPGLSNWMRFVNCARFDGEQNLEAFQYCGNIYYRTLRRIAPHEELLVWYGDDYGRQLGIDPEICDAQDEEKWRAMRFTCPGCESSYTSPLYLDKHKRLCRHIKNTENPEKRYQCDGCKYLYSHAEYLKRHTRFCRKLQYITDRTSGLQERRDSKADIEGSTETSETQNKDETDDLLSKDEQSISVNTSRETERRPSLSFSVNSPVSQISQNVTQKCQNQTEISASIKPNQSIPLKRKRSTSMQSEVGAVTPPEISAGEKDVETDREISPDINSVIPDESQPESTSEMPELPVIDPDTMSHPAEKGADEASAKKSIQEVHVSLERIPWFSDMRAAEKPHLCTDCNERFSEKHALDLHVLQHRAQTLLVCPVSKCQKTFSEERRLWEHVEIHFYETPVVISDVPSKKLPPSGKVYVPGSLKFFVCPKCHKFINKRDYLRSHPCVATTSGKARSECTSTENSSVEKCYTCVECKKSFESLQHLTLHLVCHRARNRFVSNLQGQQLLCERQDLQSYLVNGETALLPEQIGEFSLTHTLTTSVTMKFGDELFSTESTLQLRNKRGADEDVVSVSGKKKSERNNTQLAISGSLKKYLNTPKGAFVCYKCNSRFSQKSTLIVHNRTHRVEKPFICRLCKKGFLHSESFQRHIQFHKSEL